MSGYKVVVVGGGSIRNPDLLAMLAHYKERFPITELALYDIDSSKQELNGKYGEILVREYYPEIEKYTYTTDPDIFIDVDFALMQIRSGCIEMRESDEKIPLKYGVVGQETCGPGGFSYGLRSVPDILDLVKIIRDRSPKSWIINYSNPAAIVAEATNKVYPNDYRILNICDMPIAIMERYGEMLGCNRHDFEPRYFGLNHYGWFTHVYDKKTGEDLAPKIKEKLLSYNFAKGTDDEHVMEDSWIETYNFMAEMVRDFPEFLPNTYLRYYLYPENVVAHSNLDYTRANEIMDGKIVKIEKMLRTVIEADSIRNTEYALEKSNNSVHASYIVELVTSILNNENEIFLIMVKNNGVIPNLDPNTMVEVACRVGANGPEPLAMEPIDTFYKGMIESQYAYEKLTVEGLLEKNKQKLFQALTLNRTVSDAGKAKLILEDLIAANKDFWGKYFI